MIATHTIKIDGVLYKAGAEIKAVSEAPVVEQEVKPEITRRRSKKNSKNEE